MTRVRRRFRRRASALGAALLCAACGKPAPELPATSVAAPPARATSVPGARFVALPDSQASSGGGVDAQGGRQLIIGGLRLVEHPDGSLESATEFLPDRAPRSVLLPRHLGGGYLFYVAGAGGTALWRSRSWTSAVERFASVDFEVDDVVPGFDRVYVFDKRSGELLALDPETGTGRALGALPPAPAYVNMGFVDGWFGAVEVPFRGVLASFDAGASWHPVDSAQGLALEGGELLVTRGGRRFTLEQNGVLRQHEAAPAPASSSEQKPARTADAQPDAPLRALGAWPLRTAVLHGWPDTPTSAVAAWNGALGRVRLSDGKLLEVKTGLFPAGSACSAVRLGTGVGFVCHVERSRTTIFEYLPPLSVRPVMSFDQGRYVAAHDNGALSVRGSCLPRDDRRRRVYCARTKQGASREITIRGDIGAERVATLSDGRVAVVVPPRLGASGLLTLVDTRGVSKTVTLRAPKLEGAAGRLLASGLWLDGITERSDGKLATWIVGSNTFVGVQVALDGRISLGRPGKNVSASILAGQVAVENLGNGIVLETLDGGFSWSEVEVPAGFEPGKFGQVATDDARVQGCTPVGCAVGDWLRIGYWRKPERQALNVAEKPEQAHFPAAQGGRWLLRCAPTGEFEQRAAEPAPADQDATGLRFGIRFGAAPRTDSTWSALDGTPPPQRRPSDEGLSQTVASNVLQLRGYAWGPSGQTWPQFGRWQIRVSDRFALAGRVWSTAESRTPWPDFITAAQTFGQGEAGSSYTNWSAVLDASARAGVLMIKARGTSELYTFEENRSIVAFGNVANTGLGELAGAAKVGSTWYVGGEGRPQTYQLFKLSGGQLTAFAEYPQRHRPHAADGFISRVVRAARSDAVGLWVQAARLRGSASSWYVYPIDVKTGRLGEPLHLDPAQLGTPPRPCDIDVDGWVLQGQMPVEPYLAFEHAAESVRAGGVEARLVADATGELCLDSLAAVAETPLPDKIARSSAANLLSWAQGKLTVPLTLRTPTQRAQLRCVR